MPVPRAAILMQLCLASSKLKQTLHCSADRLPVDHTFAYLHFNSQGSVSSKSISSRLNIATVNEGNISSQVSPSSQNRLKAFACLIVTSGLQLSRCSHTFGHWRTLYINGIDSITEIQAGNVLYVPNSNVRQNYSAISQNSTRRSRHRRNESLQFDVK